MMADPRFSLVVPVYNVIDYLEECLSSLSAQSFGDFEVIIVDDGSNADAHARIEELVVGDKRMKVISIAHSGVSAARNAGIAVAKGEYLLFVDSDDMLLPNALEVMDSALGSELDMLWFGFSYRDSNGKIVHSDSLRDTSYASASEAASAWIRSDTLPISACNKVYRSAPIKDHAIGFREDFAFGEDRLFNLDFLQHCGSIGIVSDNLYVYRLRDGSASHQHESRMLELMLRIHDQRMEILLPLYAHEASEEELRVFEQTDYVKSVQKAWLHLAEYYQELSPGQREQELNRYLALVDVQKLEGARPRSRSQALWLSALRCAIHTRSLTPLKLMMAATPKRRVS